MHPRPVNGLRHCSTPFLPAFLLSQFALTLAKSQWIATAHSLDLGFLELGPNPRISRHSSLLLARPRTPIAQAHLLSCRKYRSRQAVVIAVNVTACASADAPCPRAGSAYYSRTDARRIEVASTLYKRRGIKRISRYCQLSSDCGRRRL
jgi:hypothetical protein